MSGSLFNLALKYVTRIVTLRRRGSQITGFADDSVVIRERRRIFVKIMLEILRTKLMRTGKKGKENRWIIMENLLLEKLI